jgi:hypothetical protein
MPEYGMETAIPCQKKFISRSTEGKVTLSLFWDLQGPVLEHYQERGVLINIAHYCES